MTEKDYNISRLSVNTHQPLAPSSFLPTLSPQHSPITVLKPVILVSHVFFLVSRNYRLSSVLFHVITQHYNSSETSSRKNPERIRGGAESTRHAAPRSPAETNPHLSLE